MVIALLMFHRRFLVQFAQLLRRADGEALSDKGRSNPLAEQVQILHHRQLWDAFSLLCPPHSFSGGGACTTPATANFQSKHRRMSPFQGQVRLPTMRAAFPGLLMI